MLLFVALTLVFTSCQKEKMVVENPAPEETIEANSVLANSMSTIAENDGTLDNIIDSNDCSSIQLPVTVIINGIEIIIDSIEDLLQIQAILDQFPDGNIEIIFPITIILNDYTTIVIQNQEQLDAFIASCDPSPTECVDFVYPISFSVFNLEFELIETVVITNDFELYFFLQGLDNTNGNIVSVNFPLSLEYDNGTVVEVNSNEELANAIAVASENCEEIVDPDPENPCPATDVSAYLQECFWYPRLYDEDDVFEYYHFTFLDNNQGTMSTSNAFIIDFVWEVYEDGDDTFIQFESNPPLFDAFRGVWKVLECSEEEIIFEGGDGGVQIVFTRNCGANLAECFGSGRGICDDDNDGFVSVNFGEIANEANCNDALEYVITFHETYEDADQLINPLASPYQTTVAGSQTFYYAITDINTGLVEYVSSYQIDAEDCGTGCDNPGLLTEELVLYMPFSGEIKDLISGQTLPSNGSFFTEDRDGNQCAIGFNENSDSLFLQTASENMIMDGDDFAISLWFKMQNDEAGDYEVMFSTSFDLNDGIQLSVYDLNTPLFVAHNPEVNLWDNDWNQEVDVQWTNTDWHHLVITYENGIARLYRDGILRNEGVNELINVGNGIGYILNAQGFIGHLDDVRVYKRGLNPNEIFMLFNDEGDCYTCLE